MKLQVKKLSDSAKLPTRAHTTDLGYDLYTDHDILVSHLSNNKRWVVDTNISVSFPEGWGGLIMDRSSLAKEGYSVHGGVIDSGYTGPIRIILSKPGLSTNVAWSVTDEFSQTVLIPKGSKIAQLVPQQVVNWTVEETDNLETRDRGEKGFGSSGL